jgi:hypothetical protein
MKTTNRLMLGLISSLLLAVGFVRAADSLDPILQGSRDPLAPSLGAAETCTAACWAIDDGS